MVALVIGFVLVSLLGMAHHYGLLVVRALKPDADRRSQGAIVVTFLGLLALHTLEIVAFAGVYGILLASDMLGELGGGYDETGAA